LPGFYFCQVGLPNCWRPIFLVLSKLDGCQINLPNCWSCSNQPLLLRGNILHRGSNSGARTWPRTNDVSVTQASPRALHTTATKEATTPWPPTATASTWPTGCPLLPTLGVGAHQIFGTAAVLHAKGGGWGAHQIRAVAGRRASDLHRYIGRLARRGHISRQQLGGASGGGRSCRATRGGAVRLGSSFLLTPATCSLQTVQSSPNLARRRLFQVMLGSRHWFQRPHPRRPPSSRSPVRRRVDLAMRSPTTPS
jgi:hypothetical protein